MHALVLLCINQYTKFEVPSFTNYKDTIGANLNKNSSGDEIANVNFLRRYRTYFKILKREPTSFNQLDDS